MIDSVSHGARTAAEHLAIDLGAGVVVQVEEALNQRAATGRPPHYHDPISLGALIVSAATLAWQIYRDLKQRQGEPPSSDAVAQTVRVELRDYDETDATQRDRIIDVVVTETIRAAQKTP